MNLFYDFGLLLFSDFCKVLLLLKAITVLKSCFNNYSAPLELLESLIPTSKVLISNNYSSYIYFKIKKSIATLVYEFFVPLELVIVGNA